MKQLLAACLLILGLCSISQATINDHGDYTHDSATGLYWLDVTKTQGITYQGMLQRMLPGGPLEGWRYAVHTELETLIQNFGIPPQGNSCYVGSFNQPIAYCDDIAPAYAETLEDLIRMLGDTDAAWTGAFPTGPKVSPDGAGMTRGIILHANGSCGGGHTRGAGWLEDGEFVYNGAPYSDAVDEIRSIYCLSSPNMSYYGSFLVRDTEPTLPITVDLDPLPLPNVPPGGQVLFNNLAPEALNLHIECTFPYAAGPCSYNADGFGAFASDGPYPYVGVFELWMSDGFNAQTQPWLRITGFDFSGASLGGGCTVGNPIIHPGTKESAEDLTLYENGNGLCRIGLTDVPYIFLPPRAAEPNEHFRIIPGTTIDYSAFFYSPYSGYTIDNVVLEFMPPNMAIEFDPWNNNEIRPTEAYFTTVDIFTTSTADGDAFDFDVSQVDITTLKLGPGMAPNVAQPLSWDRDGDGDTDMTVGFRVENSGLGCLDTEVTLTGRTLTGDPLFGRASITPVDCAKTISVDADPFNTVNEVRPEDSYVLLVGIKSTSVAAGDATDLDALQVNPASLRFGPAGAPNVTTPISTDLDGDADTDVIVGFAVEDAGILCGDTELRVEGEQYDGYPLVGADDIITTDCTEASCHP